MKTLLYEQIVIIMTLCVYLSGFMDLSGSKSHLPKKNYHFKNLSDALYKTVPVKNIVIMIVDGLRTDHLVNSNQNLMQFSRGLIDSGKGIGYMVHTETPTVTLPRIKSLLTGTIPGFMDVIFNFASKELTDENLVNFWKNAGRKIRFYGDDTWLSLFPTAFDQWKGVTSFYVTDYVQVDTNVTEQLMMSLPHKTWDVMLLHYLGLDHIGHIGGPSSNLIYPKLKEMDSIIRSIYEELEKRNETYLLLVCGDHGMSDGGGHGGASASEIMTSAMLVSNLFKLKKKLTNNFVHQVDLTSTLAIMTGVPIPNKNIGVPLEPVLESLPLDVKLLAEHELSTQLVTNALRYLKTLESEDMKADLYRVSEQHSLLSRSCNKQMKCPNYESDAAMLSRTYTDLQRRASTVLADNKHSYNMFLISFPVIVIYLVTLSRLLSESLTKLRTNEGNGVSFIYMVIYLILFATIYYITESIASALILSISLFFGVTKARFFMYAVRPITILKSYPSNFVRLFIFSFVILHPFSLLATSFVEEEHQVFYFIMSSIHCLFIFTLLKANKETRHTEVVTYADNFYHHIKLFTKVLGGKTLITWDKTLTDKVSQIAITILSWIIFRHFRYYNVTGDKWRHLAYFNNILLDIPETVKYPLLLVAYVFSIFMYSPFVAFMLFLAELMSSVPYNGVQYVYTLVTQFGPYPLLFIVLFANLAVLMPIIKRNQFIKKWILCGKSSIFSHYIFCFESFIAILFVMIQKRENYLCTCVTFVHFHVLLYLLVKFNSRLGLSDFYVCIVVFWVAEVHFFSHGNSNSLTTVRIAAGFVGITSYSPVIHGLLIAVHTFGSKIIIYLHFIRLSAMYKNDNSSCSKILRYWWLMQLIILTMYIIVVTIQRHHLFIWSVFAPKLLYEACHVICLFVVTLLSLAACKMSGNVEGKLIT